MWSAEVLLAMPQRKVPWKKDSGDGGRQGQTWSRRKQAGTAGLGAGGTRLCRFPLARRRPFPTNQGSRESQWPHLGQHRDLGGRPGMWQQG